MTLYKKELGRILKSFIFLIVAIGTILFAFSQGIFSDNNFISKPEQGNADYGMKASNQPQLIMPQAAKSLFSQYSSNKYLTYPNGFAKYVKLNQEDRVLMDEIISELSLNNPTKDTQEPLDSNNSNNNEIEINGDNLQSNSDGGVQIFTQEENSSINLEFDSNITWERFSELMLRVDDLLGGGSDFSEKWMSLKFGQIPVTYEEALSDYLLVTSKDKFTGAHARMFSDYMGIVLGLIAVFPAVFICMRDRKNISAMLYTRRISSTRFIITRFLAFVTAVMLPILILCVILTSINISDYGLENIDILAYFKYALFWVLPTVMAATAVGLFFTTLTSTPVAIAVQLVWWFVDFMGGSGVYSFFGVAPLKLIPRHNSLGKTQAFLDYLPDLIQNRIWITLIAVILVGLTILAFSAKRKGLFNVQLFKHSKVQSKV